MHRNRQPDSTAGGTRWRDLACATFMLVAAVAVLGAFPLRDLHAQTIGIPPELARFEAERKAIALALSAPIADCVARADTDNPAFHGCIDWHSAVHGTWALIAYTWATGDDRYRPLIESILRPASLAAERAHLTADPEFEMPYGRAWFLRLAIDYRRAYRSELLDAFADGVAASLVAHFTQQEPRPTLGAYDSATWALINLYDYGAARGRPDILEFVKTRVRSNYLSSSPCPLQRAELAPAEFLAVCTNWAWLVGRTLAPDEFRAWLAHFLPPELALDPIVRPASVHQIGLNFSRSWGFWGLYRQTGDARFLAAYLRHFDETYRHPAMWRGEYGTVAHWVPQFGMLAVMVSYYDWPQ